MTLESVHEEHAVKHHSKKEDFSPYILPLSILLAATLLGFSMVSAANTLSEGFGNLATMGDNPLAPAQPTSGPTALPNGAPAIIQMSAAVENPAATLGDPNAPIVVVEYSDFQCPFCRRSFEETIPLLKSKYVETGKVFFVYKDFPLTNIHPAAAPAAEAARCAGEQNKYWEMHDKIFNEQAKQGAGTVSFSTQDIGAWASEIGLDMGAYTSCVESGKYGNAIEANTQEGIAFGVSGTPSFVIGTNGGTGQLIVGAQPYAVFESAIESLLNG